MNILTLCTGNAARSVMLGYMFASLATTHELPWNIRTAGTHTSEGQAMSPRTLAALQRIDVLRDQPFTQHRSHQLIDDDVAWASIVLAAEADHVSLCRVRFPGSADRVVQLGALVRVGRDQGDWASALRVAVAQPPHVGDDIADPAGGDQSDYDRCADDLWVLAQQFAVLVAGTPGN